MLWATRLLWAALIDGGRSRTKLHVARHERVSLGTH